MRHLSVRQISVRWSLARQTGCFLLLAFLGSLGMAGTSHAQEARAPVAFELEGYWEGAYVRGASVQRVHGTVTAGGDTARIALTNEDWGYFGGRDAVPVTRTDDGRLAFDTHYGRATVDVDSTYRELIGTIGDSEPPLKVHLKKSMRPPRPPAPRTEAVTFESGDVTLSGTLVLPPGEGPHPALVYVPGRGCASRGGGVARLRWLAQYGVAGLAYDNRGAGASEGDCKTTTIETESQDVRAALQVLAQRSAIDRDRIGLWGNSAAGWYVPHAATRTEGPVAFAITQVGPATSVSGQQHDNARYIADDLGLAPADSAKFLRYVDLMFADDRPNEAVFSEMQELLAHGEETGWADAFLVRDPAIGDVPATAAGLDSLWVRRYAYDPADDLRQMTMPFLAFFGENDTVTPPAENVPRLRRLLTDAGNNAFRIAVIPETGHGFGQGSSVRTLATGRGRLDTHYWKFFRFAPDYQTILLDFLEAHVLDTAGETAAR